MTESDEVGIWIDDLVKVFDDSKVDELLINGDKFMLQRGLDLVACAPIQPARFDITKAVQIFAICQGCRLDPFLPYASGILPPVFRWQALLPKVSHQGLVFILRRHRFEFLDLDKFVIQSADRERLAEYVRLEKNLILIGPTGAGKTSLAAALLKSAGDRCRIVVLEEHSELALAAKPSWLCLHASSADVSGAGKVSLVDLFRESLRLRPDRIVLGESRREELRLFAEIIRTGHGGCLTTFHASSESDLRARLRAFDPEGGDTELPNTAIVTLARGHPPEVKAVTPPLESRLLSTAK